ncbi:hypothetical protein [Microbaculum marinum]|uniref:DUF982 domain-containing protein n=1 Tax=Microbaculum marinum TaxID=1764581 RepID=A0AAW9RP28_9HYPH
MAMQDRLSPQFDPILLHANGRYIVVDDCENAIEFAREAWQFGGDQATEWIGVHEALIQALESGRTEAFGDAVKRFRNAAHVSGWLDPHPMITANDPDAGIVSPRDAALRRASERKRA